MYDETPTDYCIFYPTRGERVAKFLIVRRMLFCPWYFSFIVYFQDYGAESAGEI
jgi:hypothetical protein